MIQLVEIVQTSVSTSRLSLREVWINPEYVVTIQPDSSMQRKLQEGLLPEDMDSRQTFTRIHLDRGQVGTSITVVGDPNTISEKLGVSRRQLLRG